MAKYKVVYLIMGRPANREQYEPLVVLETKEEAERWIADREEELTIKPLGYYVFKD